MISFKKIIKTVLSEQKFGSGKIFLTKKKILKIFLIYQTSNLFKSSIETRAHNNKIK